MNTIKEKLLEALDAAANRGWDNFTNTMAPVEWVDDVRHAVADECIRQMEWAREKCYGNLVDEVPTGKRVFNSLFVKGYSDEVKIEVYKKPLTPAPDDWRADA